MSNYTIVNGQLVSTDELYHYGVKGMKWGKRMARGHAGPGKYGTRKRQLAGDKKDLAGLEKGQHLSVGLTKKRQAAYDARDKRLLEKRIASNEKHLAEKNAKKLQKAQQKWDKAYKKNFAKAYNKAADYANETLIPKINAEYKKKYGGFEKMSESQRQKYFDDYQRRFNKVLNANVRDLIGDRPK